MYAENCDKSVLKRLLKQLWRIVMKSLERNVVLPPMSEKVKKNNAGFQTTGLVITVPGTVLVMANVYEVTFSYGCVSRYTEICNFLQSRRSGTNPIDVFQRKPNNMLTHSRFLDPIHPKIEGFGSFLVRNHTYLVIAPLRRG